MPKKEESILDRVATRRETFVPMHTTDLVDFLSHHPNLRAHEQNDFRKLARLILALLHHVYRQHHEQLTYLYAPLDPDRDTLMLSVPIASQRERVVSDLIIRLEDALRRANYHRLSQEEIEQAMSAASQWGVRMRVNFKALDRIEVYARGNVIAQKSLRRWRSLFRFELVDVQLYQRLVVIFRTRPNEKDDRFDARRLYLRMFKNIPQQDVEMVLPATRLRFTWWDHSSIVLPSLYALITTLWRLLRYVVFLTLIGLFKTLAMVLLTGFAILFGLKSMFTYTVNRRRRYHLNVAQNLYYQSLDNNAGAMLRLLEEGEQQEACESVLAYFAAAVILRQSEAGVSLTEIDQVCENLVREATSVCVNFDVEKAARELIHLGIFRVKEDRWFALPLTEANQRLDQLWDDF